MNVNHNSNTIRSLPSRRRHILFIISCILLILATGYLLYVSLQRTMLFDQHRSVTFAMIDNDFYHAYHQWQTPHNHALSNYCAVMHHAGLDTILRPPITLGDLQRNGILTIMRGRELNMYHTISNIRPDLIYCTVRANQEPDWPFIPIERRVIGSNIIVGSDWFYQELTDTPLSRKPLPLPYCMRNTFQIVSLHDRFIVQNIDGYAGISTNNCLIIDYSAHPQPRADWTHIERVFRPAISRNYPKNISHYIRQVVRAVHERRVSLIIIPPYTTRYGALSAETFLRSITQNPIIKKRREKTTDTTAAVKKIDSLLSSALYLPVLIIAFLSLSFFIAARQRAIGINGKLLVLMLSAVLLVIAALFAGEHIPTIPMIAVPLFFIIALPALYTLELQTIPALAAHSVVKQITTAGILILLTVAAGIIARSSAFGIYTDIGYPPFFGVRLLYIIPVVVIMFFLARTYLPYGHHTTLTFFDVGLLAVLVTAFAWVMLRSGNHSMGMIIPGEHAIRNSIEQILPIRPRFKEFLIGYPLLIAAGGLRRPFARLTATALGMLGPLTTFNSFLHMHTPLSLVLIRSGIGIAFGISIGIVLLIVLNALSDDYE